MKECPECKAEGRMSKVTCNAALDGKRSVARYECSRGHVLFAEITQKTCQECGEADCHAWLPPEGPCPDCRPKSAFKTSEVKKEKNMSDFCTGCENHLKSLEIPTLCESCDGCSFRKPQAEEYSIMPVDEPIPMNETPEQAADRMLRLLKKMRKNRESLPDPGQAKKCEVQETISQNPPRTSVSKKKFWNSIDGIRFK